ncbi:DUF551 domain-containing protein [Citrobacter freundii]|uniref:DUF551 domain-containing protein n=1 Tax=Citrobacter freundii TaxID=546 RepID=UPI001FF9AAB4|nr:DUF551 domain-containing protein [Citrobacter freundii]
MFDETETIDGNPKSWVAWKREAERLQKIIDEMTTNNHPAHGPVSLDRLHQIREHLQHDTQYSNGGNRAYILADMLKVIDEVQASRNAEPVLPDEKPMPEASKMHAIDAVAAIAEVRGWNACRAVILKAGNSPVTQDTWIPVSERMPDKYDFDIWVFSPSKGIHDGIQWDGCEFADDEYQFKINDVSHWMKKIYPAAPQQEVKP